MKSINLSPVKVGLSISLLLLIFGIGMGIAFGVAEDSFKDFVAQGIAANPELHDEKSSSKIWRYAQRAHFHATGISSFSLVLIMIVLLSNMKTGIKAFSSTAISLIGLYPMSWLTMFFLSPSLGRSAAHGHFITEALTYIGVGGLIVGMAILLGNLFLGLFSEDSDPSTYKTSAY